MDGDVEALLMKISEKSEMWLYKQGFGEEEDLFKEDDALPFLHGASVMGRNALGRGVTRR